MQFYLNLYWNMSYFSYNNNQQMNVKKTNLDMLEHKNQWKQILLQSLW